MNNLYHCQIGHPLFCMILLKSHFCAWRVPSSYELIIILEQNKMCHLMDGTFCYFKTSKMLWHDQVLRPNDHIGAQPAGDQYRRTDLWLAAARPAGLDQPVCIGLLRPGSGIVVRICHVGKHRARRGRRQVVIPISHAQGKDHRLLTGQLLPRTVQPWRRLAAGCQPLSPASPPPTAEPRCPSSSCP